MEEHIGFTIIREDFNEYEIENGLHLRLKPVVSDMVRKGNKNSFVLIFDLISKIIMLFKKDPSNELRYDVTKELQFRPLKETISIYETEKTIVLVVYQLERVFPTNEKNNEGTPNLRMVGSTLVNIIEKPSRATIGEIDEGSIERIWSNLMNHLCLRHRINARNGYPTDYKIEDLRIDHYGAYQDPEYFRRHVAELARRHSEIQVEGNIIRLTPEGLHYCEAEIPGWQRDF